MKVLLLGEFSGFHKNLKEGLEKLGHSVCLISEDDGWKKISGADFKLLKYKDANTKFKKIVNLLYPFVNFYKYKGYDVVHLINPFLFSNNKLTDYFINFIRKNNKVLTLSACGDDPNYINSLKLFPYAPYKKSLLDNFYNHTQKRRFELILKSVNSIIPAVYDYTIGYRNSKKNQTFVPLPINLENIEYRENTVRGKVIIYHGITRADFKGSKYIIKAMKEIEKKYEDDVEIIITERLNYKEYENIINRCNVLIDQCKSLSYGMNAVIGLAKGKVVLSGAEKESLEFFLPYKEENPIINIKPDSKQIYKVLENVILNKKEVKEIGKKSRDYVEQVHDNVLVAEKYIDVWKKYI